MKLRIINVYIIKEILPVFFSSLFVAIFIALATRMLPFMEMVVSRGAKLTHVASLFIYLLPEIFLFALPAASLISVTVSFLRFSSDSEIIALKAAGVSVYQLTVPVVFISLTWAIFAFFISIIAIPWGNSSFKELIFKLAKSSTSPAISSQMFSEPFKGIIFFVNSFSEQDGYMENVFVSDMRNKNETHSIIAARAQQLSSERDAIIIRFEDGIILVNEEKDLFTRIVEFKNYSIAVDFNSSISLAERDRGPKELFFKELVNYINSVSTAKYNINEAIFVLCEKITMPIGVFLMAIVGVPIGSRFKNREKTMAVGVSMLIFLLYYICYAAVRSVTESGFINPYIGPWGPDICLLFIIPYLYKKSDKIGKPNILPVIFKKLRRQRG